MRLCLICFLQTFLVLQQLSGPDFLGISLATGLRQPQILEIEFHGRTHAVEVTYEYVVHQFESLFEVLFILIAEVQLEFDGYRSYACHPQALRE